MVALLAAAWAWRGAGAPWPIVALLAASGLLLGFSHIRPFGPLACGALLVAAGWIESTGARRRAAPVPRHSRADTGRRAGQERLEGCRSLMSLLL